jgi:thiol-disulfide isomerase/thioredoxin
MGGEDMTFRIAGVLLLVMSVAALAAGETVEKTVLTDLDGMEVRLDSLLAEGPVVINFWATWCKPCRVEMPHLERVYEKLGPRGVSFAAVSLDSRRAGVRVRNYMEKNEVSLPVYWDPRGILARRFKVAAIPTTLLIGVDGEIAFRTRGYRPGDEILLEKKIGELLGPEEAERSPQKAG